MYNLLAKVYKALQLCYAQLPTILCISLQLYYAHPSSYVMHIPPAMLCTSLQLCYAQLVSPPHYPLNTHLSPHRIFVQALPIINFEEYKGVPKFSEVGPLTMDESVQNAVQDLLAQEKATFWSKIEALNLSPEY